MGLIIAKNDQEFFDGAYVTVWGQTGEPKTTKTATGKTVTSFSIAYDYDRDAEETKYIKCTAWQKLAEQYASLLDKHDPVRVWGIVKKDNYWSERNQKDEFYIQVEQLSAQEFHGDDNESTGFEEDELMNLP